MPAKRPENILQGTPEVVLASLRRAAAEDATREAETRKAERIGCWLWSGCAVCGALVWIGFKAHWGFGLLAVIPALLFAIPAFLFGRKVQGLKDRDLDNARTEMAMQLIEALKPDISEKAPVELVLRHGDAIRWCEPQPGAPAGGAKTYEDNWFSLSSRMQDGSSMKLGVTLSVKRKSKSKRKYTKHADQMEESLNLALRLPPERYPRLEALQPALDANLLLQNTFLNVRRIGVEPPVVRVSAETSRFGRVTGRGGTVTETGQANRLNGEKLLGLLAWVYGAVGACQAESSPKAKPAEAGGTAIPPQA
jgi:hypothetical protein